MWIFWMLELFFSAPWSLTEALLRSGAFFTLQLEKTLTFFTFPQLVCVFNHAISVEVETFLFEGSQKSRGGGGQIPHISIKHSSILAWL